MKDVVPPVLVLALNPSVGFAFSDGRHGSLAAHLPRAVFEQWVAGCRPASPVVIRPNKPLPEWVSRDALIHKVLGTPRYVSVQDVCRELPEYPACTSNTFYVAARKVLEGQGRQEPVESFTEAMAIVCLETLGAHVCS